MNIKSRQHQLNNRRNNDQIRYMFLEDNNKEGNLIFNGLGKTILWVTDGFRNDE